jgi:2-oxoisovalerate dehydrogenase E2 component (dihydrolipoyl transacylase)
MPRYEFRLPDVGEGTAEAEIAAWHVAAGDRVEEDQSLVDVMTDKAMVEMTSPVSGVVLAVHGEVGRCMPVGAVLVEIRIEGDGDESVASASAAAASPVADPKFPIMAVATPAAISAQQQDLRPPAAALAVVAAASEDPPLASPATRRRAHELGIALQSVAGTGPAARVTWKDLDDHIARGTDAAPVGQSFAKRSGMHETKIIGLRRKIAEKMQDAKRRIPHFSYVEEFDLTELEALRHELNAGRSGDPPKLTLLPFFMRALVRLLPEFPHVNARYDDDAGVLRSYEGVHIGIATQTDAGLMVPVVHHAEALDLWGCARELLRVTVAARAGSATRAELSGSTITLTSLGALGGIAATPIINHPEVAILGPNKLVDRPVVLNGAVAIRTLMNLSSSFDHRIVDGHDAARFVQRLKRLIERPALLFVEPS